MKDTPELNGNSVDPDQLILSHTVFKLHNIICMHGSRKFCQKGSNFDIFFVCLFVF